MGHVYTEKMLFLDSHPGERPGWTVDCGMKRDYDPVIARICSRSYADGAYLLSVYIGGDQHIYESPVLYAASQAEAQLEIEKLAEVHADKIIHAIRREYGTS